MNSAVKEHMGLVRIKLEKQEMGFETNQRECENRRKAAEQQLEKVQRMFNLERKDTHFRWEIPSTLLRSRLGKERGVFSDPFFLDGYRMVVFLCLRERKGAEPCRVCIGFHMKKGKFDDELEWPFRKKFCFVFSQMNDLFRCKKSITSYVQPDAEIPRCDFQTDNKTTQPNYAFLHFSQIEGTCLKCRLNVELVKQKARSN